MSWRALVVHSKEPVAISTKLHLLSEFEDVVVRLASSPEEALAAMEKESIDLVLCELDRDHRQGLVLQELARQSPNLAKIPLVMLVSCLREGEDEALAEQGVEHQLGMPFSAHQLRDAVVRAFNPRNRRRYLRLSVPGIGARIRAGGQELWGEVHNISLRGMLCELEYPPEPVDLLGPAQVRLRLGNLPGAPEAAGIEACLLRLSVDCFHDGLLPRIVRAAWKFVGVPPPAEALLAAALEEAEKSLECFGLGPDELAV